MSGVAVVLRAFGTETPTRPPAGTVTFRRSTTAPVAFRTTISTVTLPAAAVGRSAALLAVASLLRSSAARLALVAISAATEALATVVRPVSASTKPVCAPAAEPSLIPEAEPLPVPEPDAAICQWRLPSTVTGTGSPVVRAPKPPTRLVCATSLAARSAPIRGVRNWTTPAEPVRASTAHIRETPSPSVLVGAK